MCRVVKRVQCAQVPIDALEMRPNEYALVSIDMPNAEISCVHMWLEMLATDLGTVSIWFGGLMLRTIGEVGILERNPKGAPPNSVSGEFKVRGHEAVS